MKTVLLLVALMFAAGSVFADQRVNGYVRSDGTYVQPYYRSSPNNSIYDNYSTKGNINPYTGRRGTVDSDSSSSYSCPYGYNCSTKKFNDDE